MRSWKHDFIRPMLANKLSELYGQAFEDFFHRLMEAADPGFFPVGVSQGDMGADGMAISDRKLYACYAPQVARRHAIRDKFRSDLAKAVANRGQDFDVFVFVHNELRGISPEVTSEISAAQKEHPALKFENCGLNRMLGMLRKLAEDDLEDLIGPFHVEELVSGVAMAELAPLLEHLARRRQDSAVLDSIPVPPSRKLEYNRFSGEMRDFLLRSLPYVPQVRDYYNGLSDPFERDEVAAAFRHEYLVLREECDDADTVVEQLQQYILGNKKPTLKRLIEADVVLMYFFGECEIFEVPPEDWQPVSGTSVEGGSA